MRSAIRRFRGPAANGHAGEDTLTSSGHRRRSRRITAKAGYATAVVAMVGLGVTLLFNTVPSLEPAYDNDSLHVAKETAAGVVLLLVAALLLGRFRRGGRLLDLLAFAAVAVLAGKALLFSVLAAILHEPGGGLTTWRTTGTGMVGAMLLVAAALASNRVIQEHDRSRAIKVSFVGCVAALGILMAAAQLFELPGAFTDPPETSAELSRLSQDTELLIADAGAAALFLVAGAAFARRAAREEDEFQFWLGLGATIAGIAYLNYVVFPSQFTDILYAGDIFRIAAVVVWAVGTVRVIGAYQDAYAESAVQEERRRVARDLHDGVAQELSFISSQMHWLNREIEEGAEDEGSAREHSASIMEAVQRALDESRGAIAALSRPVREPLHLALAHTAEEVTRRLGAGLELDLDERIAVTPASEEALIRILREAISNAIRHGQARTVKVKLTNGNGIYLRVSDDGRGFDPSLSPSDTTFGLISMRERTETLGGTFKLSTRPGHGTSVEVVLP
jgi:signal transduction histidine kinase